MTEGEMVGWYHQLDGHEFEHQTRQAPVRPPAPGHRAPLRWAGAMQRAAQRPTPVLLPGILQARILEWVAMPSSRESSQPRDQTQVSHIAGAQNLKKDKTSDLHSHLTALGEEIQESLF